MHGTEYYVQPFMYQKKIHAGPGPFPTLIISWC